MRVLGIDTSTWTASVGVIDGDRVLSERSFAVAGSHAGAILPLIEDALSDAGLGLAEIDLLAVSIGPGSFTGLRIALSTAKGLSLVTGAPVVGVPTLEAYVHAAGPRPGVVCPVLDARKGEVYAAAFRWHGEDAIAIRPAGIMTPRRVADLIEPPCTLLGEGADVYAALWTELFGGAAEIVPASHLLPRGPVVASLGARRFRVHGADDVTSLEPVYVRRSEAEVHRDSKRATHASGVEKLTG